MSLPVTLLERVRAMRDELDDMRLNVERGCPGTEPGDMDRAAAELALISVLTAELARLVLETP